MCIFYADLQQNLAPHSHRVMALGLYMLHHAKIGSVGVGFDMIHAGLTDFIKEKSIQDSTQLESILITHMTMRGLTKNAAGYKQMLSDLECYVPLADIMISRMSYKALVMLDALTSRKTSGDIVISEVLRTEGSHSFTAMLSEMTSPNEKVSTPRDHLLTLLGIMHHETLRALFKKAPLHLSDFKLVVRAGYKNLYKERLPDPTLLDAVPVHFSMSEGEYPALVSCDSLYYTLEQLGVKDKLIFPFRKDFITHSMFKA